MGDITRTMGFRTCTACGRLIPATATRYRHKQTAHGTWQVRAYCADDWQLQRPQITAAMRAKLDAPHAHLDTRKAEERFTIGVYNYVRAMGIDAPRVHVGIFNDDFDHTRHGHADTPMARAKCRGTRLNSAAKLLDTFGYVTERAGGVPVDERGWWSPEDNGFAASVPVDAVIRGNRTLA